MKVRLRVWVFVACVVGLAALGLLVRCAVVHCLEVGKHKGSQSLHGNECYKGPVESCVHPTADEMQTYTRIAEEIVMAYSNGQVSAMQESVNQFPKEVYRLRGDDLVKVIHPVNRLWFRECSMNRQLRDFATVGEFEHYMEMRLELTKLYGNFIVDSGETAVDVLMSFDITMLKQLQGYRDKFEREGKGEFISTVERLAADWIDQIESEKGFTREYARSQKNGLWRLVERGELTEEALMANVRSCVQPLKERCGYTPKWLDVEFPTPSGQ